MNCIAHPTSLCTLLFGTPEVVSPFLPHEIPFFSSKTSGLVNAAVAALYHTVFDLFCIFNCVVTLSLKGTLQIQCISIKTIHKTQSKF